MILRDKAEELAAAHVVGSDQAQRSMPDVLDFPFHGGGRPHRDVGIPAFKCLHPGLCECERAARRCQCTTPQLLRRVFWDAPTPSKLLRRVFWDAPTPSKLLRRVFWDAPTPPNYSAEYFGTPQPLRLLRRVFWDAPTPSELLRRVFWDAPTPSELLRRVFLGRPNPLRITPPSISGSWSTPITPSLAASFFPSQCSTGRIAAKAELLRELPWAERLRREQCTRRRAAELLSPVPSTKGSSGQAEEFAAAHVVGTYPAQRSMPDVLDFPCVNGRIAVGVQHLVALLPQCRCGGEPCVHEHAAHRAVAGAWWRRWRTRSRPWPCTQTNSAQVKRPSSRPQRQAGWCLPGAWVETGHAALPGPGQSRRQPTASRAQTARKSASEAGGVYHASTVAGRLGARAPGRHRTAGRSVQRGRTPPSRSDGN